jgi:hypothetical protein
LFKQFELLIARADAINQIKMERALEAMNEAGRRMLSMLPVLLHYHQEKELFESMRNIVILNSLEFSYPLPVLMRVFYKALIIK